MGFWGKSFSTVVSFDLGKTSFDRVELRAIGNVLDLNDIKFFVALTNLFCFMNSELVHEDA